MIAERLKKARDKLGKTQLEISQAIGVTQMAYCYFENGLKVPSLPVAIQLAKVLNCSLDYLVGLVD